jgi:hypothetical protein
VRGWGYLLGSPSVAIARGHFCPGLVRSLPEAHTRLSQPHANGLPICSRLSRRDKTEPHYRVVQCPSWNDVGGVLNDVGTAIGIIGAFF